MSASKSELSTSRRQRWLRRLVVAGLFLVPLAGCLAVYLVAWQMRRAPRFSGDMKLEAPLATRFFVGHAASHDFMTNTSTSSSGPSVFEIGLEHLLGLPDEDGTFTIGPLAVLLQDDKAKPTAADLGGDGAQLLKFNENSGGGAGTGGSSLNWKCQEWWLRRASGQLDHVFVILLTWKKNDASPKHYFLPVRLRSRPGSAGVCGFNGGGSSAGGVPLPWFVEMFGDSRRDRLHFEWRFNEAKPPAEFAKEVAEQGLWEPRP